MKKINKVNMSSNEFNTNDDCDKNIEKLDIFNAFVLYILFVLLFLYSVIGVFINISFLNDKYKELETWK